MRPDLEAAWLYAIAANVCRSRRRSFFRRRRVECDDDLHALEDVLAAPQTLEAEALMGLADALAAMPESQRQAILLREWQGLSYAEIATELGITHSAVETLIFRARRTLAKGLDAEVPRTRRLVGGLNIGSVATALKGLLGGAGAAKLAAAGAVVVAASIATIPHAHHATPAPAARRVVQPRHIVPTQVVAAKAVHSVATARPVGAHRPAPHRAKHEHGGRTLAERRSAAERRVPVGSLPVLTSSHDHGHGATPAAAARSHSGHGGPGKGMSAHATKHQQTPPGQKQKNPHTPSGNGNQATHAGGSNAQADTPGNGNPNGTGKQNGLAGGAAAPAPGDTPAPSAAADGSQGNGHPNGHGHQ